MIRHLLNVPSVQRFVDATVTTATLSLMAVTSAIATEVALTLPGSPLAQVAIAQAAPAQATEDAVVYIQTERGSGSGVVIDSSGLIITNAHVVEGTRQVKVQLQGRMVDAEVVSMGSSQCLDLALLRVQGQRNLPALEFADADSIATRQEIYAIGYPGGIPTASASVVQGIISNIHPVQGFLQLDAALNPGNSGGAIVDEDMKLLGIATSRLTPYSEGINFAVSIDKVQAFVEAYYQEMAFPIGQFVIPGSGADALPQTLALNGREVSGNLEPTDNRYCEDMSAADLYSFEAEAGQAVMLEMVSSQIATYLMLVAPDGRVIAQSNSQERDRSAVLMEKLPQSGTYTVIANTINTADVTAPYQLRASTPLLVEEDALDSSTPPCTEAGHLCRSYFFEGQTNQTITIFFLSEFTPYLELLDPNGQLLGSGQVDDQGWLEVDLPTDGWYQLLISNVEASDRGNFLLSVHEAEDFAGEAEAISRQ